MDIIKFALKMEMDGKAFYEKQAAIEPNPELKEILQTLAEEEQRHYEFFKRLDQNPQDISAKNLIGSSKTLSKVMNIFQEISKKDPTSFGDNAVAVWTEALRIEEKAEAFYKEKAAQESNAANKELLNKIAAEEYNHVKMIDCVLMYIRHPAEFAESAQFKNFRSLEGL